MDAREYQRQWNQANPNYKKEWRQAHPNYNKEWYQVNSEKARASDKRRDVKIRLIVLRRVSRNLFPFCCYPSSDHSGGLQLHHKRFNGYLDWQRGIHSIGWWYQLSKRSRYDLDDVAVVCQKHNFLLSRIYKNKPWLLYRNRPLILIPEDRLTGKKEEQS